LDFQCTFLKIKNVEQNKKNVKNVKNVARIKKRKKRFYIYGFSPLYRGEFTTSP